MFESKALAYNSSRALHITDLIAKMIAKNQLPFYQVEKQGDILVWFTLSFTLLCLKL